MYTFRYTSQFTYKGVVLPFFLWSFYSLSIVLKDQRGYSFLRHPQDSHSYSGRESRQTGCFSFRHISRLQNITSFNLGVVYIQSKRRRIFSVIFAATQHKQHTNPFLSNLILSFAFSLTNYDWSFKTHSHLVLSSTLVILNITEVMITKHKYKEQVLYHSPHQHQCHPMNDVKI